MQWRSNCRNSADCRALRRARDLCLHLGAKMCIECTWGSDIVTAAALHLGAATAPGSLLNVCDLSAMSPRAWTPMRRCVADGRIAPPSGPAWASSRIFPGSRRAGRNFRLGEDHACQAKPTGSPARKPCCPLEDSAISIPRHRHPRGPGSRVWDEDGKEYVDYLIGSGPMLLGHGHPGSDGGGAGAACRRA
jgi:hypothetical protein